MKPSCKVCLSFVLAFGLSAISYAGEGASFDLGFSAPAEIEAEPGAAVSIDATGTMTPGGDLAGSGAQGWSISVSSSGWAITGISTDGTVAADVNADPPGDRNTGFEVSELTSAGRAGSDCEGSDGAVSAVVLSFVMDITLAQDAASNIVVVSLAGNAPDVGGDGEWEPVDCTVSFVDGCQGSGQPVDNRVTHMGNTIIPGLGSATTTIICSSNVSPCPADGEVAITLSGEASQEEGEVTVIQPNEDDPTVHDKYLSRVETSPDGETHGSATVYASISSNASAGGVQGWSLSAAVMDGNLTGATTAGTVAADHSMGGKRNTGFEVTELVDPALEPTSGPKAGGGPQGQGVVSAVVLSFVMNITLNATGTATVLCMTVESAAPQGDEDQVVTVSWMDGLQGAGQPVNSVMTIAGNTVRPDCCQDACITFGPLLADVYVRCDPNDDGKSDIADAVWIINALFRGGPASDCPDSSDCNGDGMRDLSDATFALAHRFQGGAPPPAPFPDCGVADPDSSGMVGDCTGRCS